MSDAQLIGRLQPMSFSPYGIETSEEQHAWQQLLYGLEGYLLPHLPRASEGLLTSQLAGPIWKRSQGYVGDATRLLRIATLAAIADGTHTINPEHLKEVRLSKRAHAAEAEIDLRRRSKQSRCDVTGRQRKGLSMREPRIGYLPARPIPADDESWSPSYCARRRRIAPPSPRSLVEVSYRDQRLTTSRFCGTWPR